MLIDEMLKLGQGSVIELSKFAGETLDVLANQKLIARGEVVVVDEKYGIRLTEIVSHTERIESLK
jgi:flagellar motor switch protein FliN/FliY